MNSNDSHLKAFIGVTIEQVRCENRDYQHLVGRKGVVKDAIVDEKGQIHLETEDGMWCPLRLCSVL